MDELAERLQVSKEELMDAVADTGYELVPAEGPAGVAGLEEGMAEEEGAAEEEGGMRSLEDVLSGIEGEEEGVAEEEVEEEEEMMDPAPAGMEGGGVKGVSISVMRGKAAKNAFEKHKKKDEDEESA